MSTARQVSDGFQTLISDNSNVIAKLDETLRETAKFRSEAEEDYGDKLSRYVANLMDPLDSPSLKIISGLAGGKVDLEQDYKDIMSSSKRAEQRIAALIMTNGEPEEVKAQLDDVEKKLKTAKTSETSLRTAIASQTEKADEAIEFNATAAKAGKPQLSDAASYKYFSSKTWMAGLWARAFDSHYKQGRQLIEDFNGTFDKPVGDVLKEYADNKASHTQTQATLKSLGSKKETYSGIISEMATVQTKIVDETEAKSTLGSKIVVLLAKTPVFEAVAKALAGKMPEDIIESRAKIQAYRKIEDGLNVRKQTLTKASKELGQGVTKLKEAVRRKPNMEIKKINLPKIQQGMKAQQVMGKQAAVEMRKANASIRSFKAANAPKQLRAQTASPAASSSLSPSSSYAPSTYSPLDMYVDMMVWHMIFDSIGHSSPDTHTVNSVMGISENVASSGGIDLASLTPDFSADVTAGLSASDMNFDVGSVIDSISFDMPAFELPSFEMPDMPDISFPDIDF